MRRRVRFRSRGRARRGGEPFFVALLMRILPLLPRLVNMQTDYHRLKDQTEGQEKQTMLVCANILHYYRQ